MQLISTQCIGDYGDLISDLLPDFGSSFWEAIQVYCGIGKLDPRLIGKYWESWLAENEDGAPIGITGLYSRERRSTKTIWIGWFGVATTFRGRRFGTELLRETERQATLIGAEEILVYADEKAKSFYEHHGFSNIGTVQEYCDFMNLSSNERELDFGSPYDFVLRKSFLEANQP